MFAVCSLISSDCSLVFFAFAFAFSRCGQTLTIPIKKIKVPPVNVTVTELLGMNEP